MFHFPYILLVTYYIDIICRLTTSLLFMKARSLNRVSCYSYLPANDTPPQMIHFAYMNKFHRNAYFFTKQNFLATSTSFLCIVKM